MANNIDHGSLMARPNYGGYRRVDGYSVPGIRCCKNGIATDFFGFDIRLDLRAKVERRPGYQASRYKDLGCEVWLVAAIKEKGNAEWKHYRYNLTKQIETRLTEKEWTGNSMGMLFNRGKWDKYARGSQRVQMQVNGKYPCTAKEGSSVPAIDGENGTVYEIVFRVETVDDDDGKTRILIDERGKPIDGRTNRKKVAKEHFEPMRLPPPLKRRGYGAGASWEEFSHKYYHLISMGNGWPYQYAPDQDHRNCEKRKVAESAFRILWAPSLYETWDDNLWPAGFPRSTQIEEEGEEVKPLGSTSTGPPDSYMNSIFGGNGTPNEFGSNWANGQEYTVMSWDDANPECGDCGYGGYGYGGGLNGTWCNDYQTGICDGQAVPGGGPPSNWDQGGPEDSNGNCKYVFNTGEPEPYADGSWVAVSNTCIEGTECPEDAVDNFPEGTVDGQFIYTGCIPE